MKKLICTAVVSSLLFAAAVDVRAESPGYVDFGNIAELAGGSTVDIHLKGPLLSMAAKIVDKSEAEVAELLGSLQLVRVNVFKLDDKNREEVHKRIKAIRGELEGKKWDQLVSVREKNEEVGVYVKTRGEEALEGLVVTVLDGKREAVLVNIVGDFKPEQLGTLAEKFNIDVLKKMSGKGKKKQASQ
jgi:hypothetical protein